MPKPGDNVKPWQVVPLAIYALLKAGWDAVTGKKDDVG